ncbi:UvrD-helicase domain-containing protein [Hydrogenophaga sp.]|uniref:UvrD-helicase domain-containing protein n=1 Tax=Hydrogenophaga sp. TaxID=1904254 RepID=UPI003D277EF7
MKAAAYRLNGALTSREDFYALACDPARSVAVEACAGAGKTWMLVSRILRALLDGCAAQDILAITFTRKAAGEMRERLQSELRRWATLSDMQLAAELRSRGLSESDALRRASEARGLHARVLAQGRTVQVRTFHGWFAALLRGAPLSVLQELHLPVQYEPAGGRRKSGGAGVAPFLCGARRKPTRPARFRGQRGAARPLSDCKCLEEGASEEGGIRARRCGGRGRDVGGNRGRAVP